MKLHFQFLTTLALTLIATSIANEAEIDANGNVHHQQVECNCDEQVAQANMNAAHEREALQNEIRSITERFEHSQNEIRSITERFEQTQNDLNAKTRDVQHLQGIVEAKDNDIQSIRADMDGQLQGLRAEMDREVNAAKEAAAIASKELEETRMLLETSKKDAEAASASSAQKVAEAGKQAQDVLAKVKSLQDELDAAKKQLDGHSSSWFVLNVDTIQKDLKEKAKDLGLM